MEYASIAASVKNSAPVKAASGGEFRGDFPVRTRAMPPFRRYSREAGGSGPVSPCRSGADRSPVMPARDRLAPFDQLMLEDARRGYPMCFHVECAGSGPLDQARFTAAVRQAAERHPRLRSRIETRWLGPHWLPPDRDPAVEWAEPRGPAAGARDAAPPPWRPIDPRVTSGVRFVGFAAPARWRVVMTVHHAVCDGLAALEYWGDIWTAYHGAEPPPFAPGRTFPRPAEPPPSSTEAGLLSACREFTALLPAPLATPRRPDHGGPPAAAMLPYATLWLEAERTARLRSAAADLGGTVNDALVAATFATVAEWNRRAGAGRGTRLRILMPVSLRAPGERGPARNLMSYAFLDRSLGDCLRAADLVASLAAASRWVQETGAAARFLATLDLLARLPGALRAATRLPLSMSTAVASWLGNVTRRMQAAVPIHDGRLAPGGLTVESLAAVPPIRPGTAVALAMLAYADGIAISGLADGRRLGPGADGLFLELLDRTLDDLVAAAPPAAAARRDAATALPARALE